MKPLNKANNEEMMGKSYSEGVFECSPSNYFKQICGVLIAVILLIVILIIVTKDSSSDGTIDDKYFSCNITSYVKTVGSTRQCFNCDRITPQCMYCNDESTCTECNTGYILNSTK